MLLHGVPPSRHEMLAAIGLFRERPLVSLLVCVDTVEPERLGGLLATLRAQSYERWELCLAVPRGLSPVQNSDLDRLRSRTSLASGWRRAPSARTLFVSPRVISLA